MRRRVLAVSHDGSRSGAPVMLLHFVRWMREHVPDEVDVDVVLLRGGPLAEDFRALAPTRVLAPIDRWTPAEVVTIGLDKLGLGDLASAATTGRLRAALARSRGHDAIWLNSAASAPALRALTDRRSRVVTALHELDQVLDALPGADLRRLIESTDRFVAGAAGIAENMLRRPGVDPERMTVAHEFIDIRREIDGRPRAGDVDRAALRRDIRVPEDAFVVGACASASWRKGPDLFIRLAVCVRRMAPELGVHFVWVGGPTSGVKFEPLAHDLGAAGLHGSVHFVGPREDLTSTFAIFDVFALTSREDALPLVCLEAARAGSPVVAFDNTFLSEFFTGPDGDAGVEVPFLDVEAMAAEVISLARDPERRRRLAERARGRLGAGFDVTVGAPRWWSVLEGELR